MPEALRALGFAPCEQRGVVFTGQRLDERQVALHGGFELCPRRGGNTEIIDAELKLWVFLDVDGERAIAAT
jgi:hypothetical protein